jgi:hypothetical protein
MNGLVFSGLVAVSATAAIHRASEPAADHHVPCRVADRLGCLDAIADRLLRPHAARYSWFVKLRCLAIFSAPRVVAFLIPSFVLAGGVPTAPLRATLEGREAPGLTAVCGLLAALSFGTAGGHADAPPNRRPPPPRFGRWRRQGAEPQPRTRADATANG